MEIAATGDISSVLPSGADLVLDDHRLAERLAHLVGEQARKRVARGAGRVAEHDPDGAFLGCRGLHDRKRAAERERGERT
jgi:hypothetical protein